MEEDASPEIKEQLAAHSPLTRQAGTNGWAPPKKSTASGLGRPQWSLNRRLVISPGPTASVARMNSDFAGGTKLGRSGLASLTIITITSAIGTIHVRSRFELR